MQTLDEQVELPQEVLEKSCDGQGLSLSQIHKGDLEFVSLWGGHFCGRCGGRRAQISHKTSYRKIRFMPDASDYGRLRSSDGSGQTLIVKCPKILNRSPSPGQENHIRAGKIIELI